MKRSGRKGEDNPERKESRKPSEKGWQEKKKKADDK